MTMLTGTGEGPINKFPAICGSSSLVGKEGFIVISDGGAASKSVVLATATSDAPLGILVTAGAVGAAVEYAGPGSRVRAKAGGTVSAGSPQMFATGGKITDASGNVKVVGIAVEDGVDGDLVLIDVAPGTIGTG
jgi:hypothetical protein